MGLTKPPLSRAMLSLNGQIQIHEMFRLCSSHKTSADQQLPLIHDCGLSGRADLRVEVHHVRLHL